MEKDKRKMGVPGPGERPLRPTEMAQMVFEQNGLTRSADLKANTSTSSERAERERRLADVLARVSASRSRRSR